MRSPASISGVREAKGPLDFMSVNKLSLTVEGTASLAKCSDLPDFPVSRRVSELVHYPPDDTGRIQANTGNFEQFAFVSQKNALDGSEMGNKRAGSTRSDAR